MIRLTTLRATSDGHLYRTAYRVLGTRLLVEVMLMAWRREPDDPLVQMMLQVERAARAAGVAGTIPAPI